MEGLGINSFPRRMPQLRPLGMSVATQVSAVGCCYWDRRLLIPRIAPQGRGQTHRGSAEARSEQPVRNTPVPHYAERDSKVLNRREHGDQGPGARQPSETAPERIFGSCRDGGDAHEPVQSWRSRGKSWCSGYAIVRIDHHQLRREVGMTGLLGMLQLWSVSQRQLKHLVPSKPSRNPSPSSMLNIRFILTLCSRSFTDDYIFRTLLPLRTRSKYFARASPH